MSKLSRRSLIAVALPAMAATAVRAQDAEDYPTHPVTFVVPFAKGGGTDTLGHMLGDKLQERFGQPFAVQNRPGQGTVIATNFVSKSRPDGYTIMMAVSTLAIDATLYKKLPYDPARDFAMLALVSSVPFVLVVSPSLPVYSVADLINLAKQKPLSYGSGGVGDFHHLAAMAQLWNIFFQYDFHLRISSSQGLKPQFFFHTADGHLPRVSKIFGRRHQQ